MAQVEFKSSAILSSPAMDLNQLGSSWANPQKGDYAQGRIRLETSFGLSKTIQLGFQKRFDYLLAFNEQTAQFYSALENNHVSNGEYSLFLDMNAAQSNSLFIGYEYKISSRSKINLRSHLIQGERLQEGRVIGRGEVAGNSVSYTWDLQYAYDENRLFKQPQYSVEGWGYSFDLNYEYHVTNSSIIKLEFEDLLYHLYWQQVEQDNGCLSRPIKTNCAVSATKGAYKQILPAYLSIKWTHGLTDQLLMHVLAEHWSKYSAYAMGIKYDQILFNYDWHNKTYNLGYESEYLRVKWGFDQFNYHGANQWQILLDVTWPIYDL